MAKNPQSRYLTCNVRYKIFVPVLTLMSPKARTGLWACYFVVFNCNSFLPLADIIITIALKYLPGLVQCRVLSRYVHYALQGDGRQHSLSIA